MANAGLSRRERGNIIAAKGHAVIISAVLAVFIALAPPGTAPLPEETGTDMPDTPATDMVHDLPFSQGQGFATLDAYLQHLKSLAPQDRPYYEEVEPGRYRHITGRRGPGETPDDTIYTREDLLERYGFSE